MAATQGVSEQQKDHLCGPYFAARILQELGAGDTDEDLIALLAGTILPDVPEPSTPPGAESRSDYRYQLRTGPAAEAGTAADALVEAIEVAGRGRVRCLPVRGAWTPGRVEGLVEAGPRLGARLLANLRTGRLWGSRPPVEFLLAELKGRRPEAEPPPDWDVGHFCELAHLVRGSRGSLVLVHDSYPSLGWKGYHLQPPRAVAGALVRGDGREGGVLAVVPAERAGEMKRLVLRLGLQTGIWDNGTRR